MPEVLDTWIHALVKHRRAVLEIDHGKEAGDDPVPAAEDPVLAALERRHERIKVLRRTVLDRHRTSFVLVTIPERLAIEETARAAELLTATGIEVAALIVNRVLPDDVEGAFYRSRKAQEAEYLEEITRRFPRLRRTDVGLLPRDVYGVASLTLVSHQLFASPAIS
jgi:arsenite-transporting ATPase